ncbi:ATP-binding protein [Anaerotaenia torta]|uniref:sensor histidine kinase n=1 Tax=Anaerotaenia torta TaxID=433293 RepID=UPI003D2292F1
MLAIFSKIKAKLRFLNSMRVYLLLIFTAIGVIPLYFFTHVLLNTYEEKALGNRVREMENQGYMLSGLLYPRGFLTTGEDAEVELEVTRISDIYGGRIVIVDGSTNIVKDTYSLEEGKYLISGEVIQCLQGSGPRSVSDRKTRYIKLIYPITHNESKEVMGAIIMSFSTKDIYSIRSSMEQRVVLFAVILGIINISFAIYFSGILTKPLTRVVNSIDRITDGYMNESVSIKGYTEIEKISDSFNHMMNRMQKLENSRQEFVSNVSHELKTPITSIKVLADSLLMQEEVPVELYREFLVDITDEIERENKIINDLLSLVKLDKTAGDMNIAPVNINELLELILKRLTPIAKRRNIEMIYESFRPVVAEVDEVKLSLALSNLIENAIKYNTEDGWVRISLNADHKYFFVKVSDSGIGIPLEAQDFIFERFYRVDKARSRETGGTGLGLAITKNVIQMHRGAIKVYSKEGEGTTFNVRIPLNYIP